MNNNQKKIPVSVFIISIVAIIAIAAVIIVIVSNNKSETEETASKSQNQKATQAEEVIDLATEIMNEEADLSNIGSAYAELVSDYLMYGDAKKTVSVSASQKKDGWQTDPEPCLTYGASDGTTKSYYFSASTSGYVVGIEIYDDSWCRPVVKAMD